MTPRTQVSALREESEIPSVPPSGEVDALQLLRQDTGHRSRRPSTVPPPARLQAVVGSHRFEVDSLTPLEAVLRANEEIPSSVPNRGELALELRGTRIMTGLFAEISTPSEDPRSLVAKFADMGIAEARVMIAFMKRAGAPAELPFTQERITNAARVETLLKALAWSQAQGSLVDAGNRRARVHMVQVELAGDPTLLWTIDRRDVVPPFEVEVRGPWSVFSFRLESGAIFGGLLATNAPAALVRKRRRIFRRVDDGVQSELGFAHPIWPDLEIRARVQDVSFGGMAVRVDSEAMLLFPGLEIPRAEILSGPATGSVMAAQVCHVGGQDAGEETACGLCVSKAVDADDVWAEAVRERVYPRTTSGATPFGALWRLYVDSGYLGIGGGKRSRATPNRANASRSIASLDTAPGIAVNVVWPTRRGVTGALTLVKMYKHTWFGQHMAKRRGPTSDGWPGRQVLREMHLHAYEHALRDADTRWLLGYVRHDAGWPKLVHVEFPERAQATGQTCIVPFRAIRIPCGEDGPALFDPEIEVRAATDDDLAELAAAASSIRPSSYVEALDLVEDRLRMSVVEEAWARAGLMRERVVLVADQAGRPAAAGVFEATSDGVHLFGLLDCARLFALREGGERAFLALLGAARRWFIERKRAAYVYLAEGEPVAGLDRLGARDMGAADATVTPVALLPDLLEHMWEVTASAPVLTM